MAGQAECGSSPPPLPGRRRLSSRWGVVLLVFFGSGVLSMLLFVGVQAGGKLAAVAESDGGEMEGGGVPDGPEHVPPIDETADGQDPDRDARDADGEGGEQAPAEPAPDKPAADDDAGEERRDVFADIRARNNVLVLPRRAKGRVLNGEPAKRLLVTIYTGAASDCELMLVPRIVSLKGAEYEIVADVGGNGELKQSWRVQRRGRNGGLGSKRSSVVTIGSFSLVSVLSGEVPGQREQLLSFVWGAGVRDRWASEFRNMELSVRVGAGSAVCSFVSGVKMAPIAIRFGKRKELGPDLAAILPQLPQAETADLFVDLVPEGFPDGTFVWVSGNGIQTTRSAKKFEEVLRGIPLWDLSHVGRVNVKIGVGQVDEKLNTPCVNVSVVFVPPGKAGHKGLSVKWDCEVIGTDKNGVVYRQRRQGFTLNEAEWERKKMTALEKATKRQLSDVTRRLNALRREVLRVQLESKTNGFNPTIENELKLVRRKFSSASEAVDLCKANLQLIEQYGSVPMRVLACMKQLQEGRARIGWRIYEKRDGRQVNLAFGL